MYICHRITRNLRCPWRDIRFVALFFLCFSLLLFSCYILSFISLVLTASLACKDMSLFILVISGGIQISPFCVLLLVGLHSFYFYFYLFCQSCSSSAILVILFIVLFRVRESAVSGYLAFHLCLGPRIGVLAGGGVVAAAGECG